MINPSGGALAANPLFSAGLERIGYAATTILGGNADTALAHATSGPAAAAEHGCSLGGTSN